MDLNRRKWFGWGIDPNTKSGESKPFILVERKYDEAHYKTNIAFKITCPEAPTGKDEKKKKYHKSETQPLIILLI